MAAYYRKTVAEFLNDPAENVMGSLSGSYQHNELQKRQLKAWKIEIQILKLTCEKLIDSLPSSANWSLLLEYPIPRRLKRLDGVLIASDVLLCLEFKTGDQTHSLAADRQVEDYALDLRDFHEASSDRIIIPISIVPRASKIDIEPAESSTDAVWKVTRCNENDLAAAILHAYNNAHSHSNQPIEPEAWDKSPYHPVPTIIEAAEVLFAGHNVREIAHSHAGAKNLTITSERIIELIQKAQANSEKIICFVTGIPGAGKTLAGLNIVHNPALRLDGRPAGVFLSGNGPLVKIVSAAIARDQKRRLPEFEGKRTVGAFIQNVHAFIEEGMEKPDKPPVERVVVFDEAQRAWNADQNRKKNQLDTSEPETMLSIMDRHKNWAVLVALVGGGQEIHNGEAGLSEWGRVLQEKFPNWKIAVSPKALESDASTAGQRLFADGLPTSVEIHKEPALHLDVNLRSFRAQRFAEWVDAVLACNVDKASAVISNLKNFPIALTSSLGDARQWLCERARGQQRAGLVASSGALRLRAEGIELSSGFRQGNRDIFVNWFLNLPPDIRSSNQLEVAASEFECQGLELDWVGLCWGGDLSIDAGKDSWLYRNFSGTRWGLLRNEIDRQYLLNSYRVLLTRARRGLIIWVPQGDVSDQTHLPNFYQPTFDYLIRCGVPII